MHTSMLFNVNLSQEVKELYILLENTPFTADVEILPKHFMISMPLSPNLHFKMVTIISRNYFRQFNMYTAKIRSG